MNSEMWTIRQRHVSLRNDLEKEALTVQPAIDAEVRATHDRYTAEQRVIDEKVQRLEAAKGQQLRETDERIARVERELADLRFKQEGKRREVQALAAVAFGPYLRRVLRMAA